MKMTIGPIQNLARAFSPLPPTHPFPSFWKRTLIVPVSVTHCTARQNLTVSWVDPLEYGVRLQALSLFSDEQSSLCRLYGLWLRCLCLQFDSCWSWSCAEFGVVDMKIQVFCSCFSGLEILIFVCFLFPLFFFSSSLISRFLQLADCYMRFFFANDHALSSELQKRRFGCFALVFLGLRFGFWFWFWFCFFKFDITLSVICRVLHAFLLHVPMSIWYL